MASNQFADVVIIGGGPAGISAGIWCKRIGLDAIILEQKEQLGGQLHQIHNEIVDYPGVIARNGAELSARFEEQIRSLHIPIFLGCKMNSIDLANRIIHTSLGEIRCKYVILASGAKPRMLHIPGEKEMIARGEVYSTNKDQERLKGKRILIVGGGDRALEGAINLADVADSLYLIHRSPHFRARHEYVEAVKENPKITIWESTLLKEISGKSRVETVTLFHIKEQKTFVLPIDAVLIRIGVEPCTEGIPEAIRRNENGAVQVNEKGQTNVPWIYAIGDLVNPSNLSSIILSAGQGMKAAKMILENLRDQPSKENHDGIL